MKMIVKLQAPAALSLRIRLHPLKWRLVGPKAGLDVSEITLDRSDRSLFAVPALTICFLHTKVALVEEGAGQTPSSLKS